MKKMIYDTIITQIFFCIKDKLNFVNQSMNEPKSSQEEYNLILPA